MSGLSVAKWREAERVLKLLPLDETGHVTECGYGESETCGCYSLPSRISEVVDEITAAALAAFKAEAVAAIEAEAALQQRCEDEAADDEDSDDVEIYEQGVTVAHRILSRISRLNTT